MDWMRTENTKGNRKLLPASRWVVLVVPYQREMVVGMNMWIFSFIASNTFSLIWMRLQERSFWDLGTSRRRQWHPTPVLLPGKSHGRRSLVQVKKKERQGVADVRKTEGKKGMETSLALWSSAVMLGPSTSATVGRSMAEDHNKVWSATILALLFLT